MLNLFIGDMYNRCTLQLSHFTLKPLIQGHPQNTKVPHVADFKSVSLFYEIYKSHGGLTANIPFTNHKNKYFIVQMVAYTIIHVNSEQDQSVI